MSAISSKSTQKVQQALEKLELSYRVVELPASTRTAIEAAQAIGCQVAQIVKSLVFRGKQTNKGILVLASGINRVDETRLAQYCGEPIAKADAEFVLSKTGFAIGGVPPLAHATIMETYIDQDLYQWEKIWAAAGTPHAVFSLHPADLELITSGKIVEIK